MNEHMIRPLADGDVTPFAELIVQRQIDPTTHVAYVGITPDDITAELAEAADWRARTLVSHDADGRPTGVLLADIDRQMRRVWWCGPWTADPSDADLARRLLDDAGARWGALYDEQELGPDARHAWMLTLAEERGFQAQTGSALLSVILAAAPHGPDASQPARTMPLRAADRAGVAALHDLLVAGTHATGVQMVFDSENAIRVAHDGEGQVAGYISTQLQPNGSGYIEHLGVAEHARRHGCARALVTDAMGDMAMRGVPSVHLAVRADAPDARSLYRSLGYTEERVIVVHRKGFPVG
jgi:ribosomal protein S18 acetylase RimI-like enzyme